MIVSVLDIYLMGFPVLFFSPFYFIAASMYYVWSAIILPHIHFRDHTGQSTVYLPSNFLS